MKLSEEQIKKYACKLEVAFIKDFLAEYYVESDMYDSNVLLEFLLDYHEVNDRSKQYFYYMTLKMFDDIPPKLMKAYNDKFAIQKCGREIYNSYGCSNSNLLLNCNDIRYSFGCNKCKFSDHLLYCTEQRHKSYMAFNKPITKQRYYELIRLSPDELKSAPEFDGGLYSSINSLIEYIYKIK